MRSLSALDMLNVWEQGLNQPLLHRALIMLVAAFPETTPDNLAQLSIGQRDERLLLLRERLFGTQLVNTAICPACAERIEWENRVADLLIPRLEKAEPASNEFDLEMDDFHLHCRLPNSLDIAEVINDDDTEKAQEKLLSRCILEVECAGEKCTADQLPDHLIQAINQRIDALDPQAEVRINLSCPGCSHSWEILFDIASFLWLELNDWAEWTLQTVHKLARGYGWTEQEVLNLSPIRRQLYLGMLGA